MIIIIIIIYDCGGLNRVILIQLCFCMMADLDPLVKPSKKWDS